MDLLLVVLVLIAVIELKEWRVTKRYEELDEKIEQILIRLSVVIEKNSEIIDLLNDNSSLFRDQLDSNERKNMFIDEAKRDLETIVKEYKINGIPLGYERRRVEQDYDTVEGL